MYNQAIYEKPVITDNFSRAERSLKEPPDAIMPSPCRTQNREVSGGVDNGSHSLRIKNVTKQ